MGASLIDTAAYTEPTLIVVNAAGDACVTLDAGDDAVAHSKDLYFKAAADEDIELINLSLTGTPRIFWDETADAFASSKDILNQVALGVIQRTAYAQIMEILGDVSLFYPFTDATGSTVTDFTANGFDGTPDEAVEAWDTPPAYQGSVQVYDF
ncbi:unnamed protein product, partial [marine sediment metagenome]